MIEIKFRAWHKDYGMSNIFTLGEPIECGGAEIMQYTGLHDKNGREIYEGDVVKAKWGGIGLVEYGKYHDDGDLDGPVDFIGFYIKWSDGSTSYADLSEFEVIGNMYENPELLKESE